MNAQYRAICDHQLLKNGYLQTNQVTPEIVDKIKKLNDIAIVRGQTLAQMALAWILKDPRVTSVLIGASKVSQLEDSLKCLENLAFSEVELGSIEGILW